MPPLPPRALPSAVHTDPAPDRPRAMPPAVPPAQHRTLDLPLIRRGKVRDVYRLPDDPATGEPRLLMVASDRVSAFDVVMPTPIPGKGRVLTSMASWWFSFISQRRLAEVHARPLTPADIPAQATRGDPALARWLDGRVTLGLRCDVIPVECVVRGYLEGSGWKEYQATGSVCGVPLPPGLRQCDRLPHPVFTPATKAEHGHDQNITFEHAADLVGFELVSTLRDISLAIYSAAAAHALDRGIIIADTKFEFGLPAGDRHKAARVWSHPVLIDEALTPDSSRFWPADAYTPGRPQPSFDKQFLREHLEGLAQRGLWDKTPPGPELPDHIVRGTLERYRQALRLITGLTPPPDAT